MAHHATPRGIVDVNKYMPRLSLSHEEQTVAEETRWLAAQDEPRAVCRRGGAKTVFLCGDVNASSVRPQTIDQMQTAQPFASHRRRVMAEDCDVR